jgi:hypothetical protein
VDVQLQKLNKHGSTSPSTRLPGPADVPKLPTSIEAEAMERSRLRAVDVRLDRGPDYGCFIVAGVSVGCRLQQRAVWLGAGF